MLNCRQATENISAQLDDVLSPGERRALRVHLVICRNCRRYLRQMRATVGTVRGLDGFPEPGDGRHLATLVERLALSIGG